jgi:hypothetical protein
MQIREGMPTARGRVRAYHVPHLIAFCPATMRMTRDLSGRMRDLKSGWTPNLVLRSWAGIVGKLLTTGESKYRISGMYVEFMNVASPGDPAPIPSYDRSYASGREYYDGLSASPSRDFLRVPLIASTLEAGDEDLFPDGNLVTFFAQTSGVVGTHGKNFGESFNSVVVGGALIAQVSQADATQDLVLSRFYFEEDDQQPKLDVGQVGLEWELELQ